LSRAFVSEDAADATASLLPERPVSAGPNPVTARGLGLIEAEIARLQALHDGSAKDDPGRPATDRDLRYWKARRDNATVVPPVDGAPDTVGFGSRVTLLRGVAGSVTYRIVGEDEADPARGLLSWSSPLAAALMGGRVGDEIDIGGGRALVTIDCVEA
jgi:transcription elongation GreA/GreB family factor